MSPKLGKLTCGGKAVSKGPLVRRVFVEASLIGRDILRADINAVFIMSFNPQIHDPKTIRNPGG